MVNTKIRFDLLKIKRYFKENWGTPFIILFQALFFSSGGFLIQGNSALASSLATYSYYALLIGVALQLISFLLDARRKKKNNE